VAVDDTKVHRTSKDVWGTCTFYEYTARCPNRAQTVRAHNWVVAGALLPGKPWQCLLTAGRLYFRESQVPAGERFVKKTDQLVALVEEMATTLRMAVLGVFDGAYAMETVIRPCLNPPQGRRRIDFVTRLRKDARLYHPLEFQKKNPQGGRPRKWGRRMAAPQNHEQWDVDWQPGRAFIYGRIRSFRYKRVLCQWAVSGPEHLVYAYVFEVEGYEKPWYTVTSALDLSPSQTVATVAARYRQEDGFRDHKQRLGMEECRAWTKEPVLRTFQVQMVTQSLLRLMESRLDQQRGPQTWWSPPEWNPKKRHPSILDLRRLFWRHRERFSKFLLRLEEMTKPPQAHFPCGRPTARAA